ncbi:MAG TPA: N-acetylneuraminate synthase family protein, partial [Magnetospirillum sp.]|nr:N-acetylneuraminate synthase family protein [Magnetospirillum sp.]
VRAARHGVDVLISSGMSSMADVETGLGALAFGYTAPAADRPGPAAFSAALVSAEGRDALKRKVGLFHCTSNYPAKLSDVNLRSMATLAGAFDVDVGYSDHTEGSTVAIASVALGARMIEKHLTLDRTLPGPDHAASLNPAEFGELVRAIRDTETILGHGWKVPCPAELDTQRVARKSLVVAEDIRAGEVFTEENLTVKRPGTGMPPARYWDMLGRTASRDYQADDVLDLLP